MKFNQNTTQENVFERKYLKKIPLKKMYLNVL